MSQVFTPAGKQRIARLKSEAMSNDPSRLRAGVWGSAWDAVLGWTIQYVHLPGLCSHRRSWSEYRSAPVRLPFTNELTAVKAPRELQTQETETANACD